MNEQPIQTFRDAIEATHGCRSSYLGRTTVQTLFEGFAAWTGEILVFDLLDHPTAQICYAWEVDGKVTAVLHQGPVDSPEKAVRAAILHEHEKQDRSAPSGFDDEAIARGLRNLPSRKDRE